METEKVLQIGDYISFSSEEKVVKIWHLSPDSILRNINNSVVRELIVCSEEEMRKFWQLFLILAKDSQLE